MKAVGIRFSALFFTGVVLLCASASLVYPQSRISYNQQQLFLSGSNIAWYNFARDLGPTPLNTVAFRTVFDSIHANGGNSLRLWLHTTGASTPQFDAGGKVIGPGTIAIASLTTILDMAWQRKIGLILCLWSFDMMKISNGSLVTNRSQSMLTDTSYTNSYIRNALIPMVAAVKAHPGIISWEVFNEAEGMSNEFGWADNYHVPMANIQRFVNLVAGAIHRTDSTTRVTTGSWALIAQTDVNLVAKPVDLATRLNSMTSAEKQKVEDAFAARYGSRMSAAEILAPYATLNYNYYKDDRLVAAGGDPLGTLDFYTVHYYDWQSTPISPFHHPYAAWNLTKPLVIAEFFPEQTLGIPFTDLYRILYDNGYAGGLSWGWYSGASGHSQSVLQANTMVLTKDLFSRYPDEIEVDPVSGKVYSFSASPVLIDSGETSLLTWKTTLGTSATLDGGYVAIRGSRIVSPAATTTYTLRTSGTTHDSSGVTVTVYPSGKILSFTASANTIAIGDSARLKWRTAHGSQVSLNGSAVNRVDSIVVRPDSTTTYTLTTAGSVRDTSSVTVVAVRFDQINRALLKNVSVSSSSLSPGLTDRHSLVDGDSLTEWGSYAADNQWIDCDLGETLLVKRVVIRWGSNFASAYRLRLSPDNNNWLLARTVSNGGGGKEVLDSIDQIGRYVTLSLDTRAAQGSNGFIVRELEVYGVSQTVSVPGTGEEIPEKFALLQNYPNPFNPSTTISFAVPAPSRVVIKIFNLIGQQVAEIVNGPVNAGFHKIKWKAPAASGVYFCRMEAVSFAASGQRYLETRKIMVLR